MICSLLHQTRLSRSFRLRPEVLRFLCCLPTPDDPLDCKWSAVRGHVHVLVRWSIEKVFTLHKKAAQNGSSEFCLVGSPQPQTAGTKFQTYHTLLWHSRLKTFETGKNNESGADLS